MVGWIGLKMDGKLKFMERKIEMAEIGEPQREVEFEPMPETVPVQEPAAPVKTPEPTPA